MAGQSRSSSQEPVRWIRSIFLFVVFAAMATGGLMAFQSVESLLISDRRFVLAPPPEYSSESPNVRITGVRNTSRRAVLQVLGRDFGRSVYLLPVAERRRNLLAIDWVRDATVSRVWPNRIDIYIEERKPVAYVALADGGNAARPTLIDEDGVLLEPQGPVRTEMPVLMGIRRDQSESVRRDRVHRMRRLLEEVGSFRREISDVDVSDPENLTVTMKVANRAAVLILGNRDFRDRLENFVQHYPEIRKYAPQATLFDLRLEDRITLPPDSERTSITKARK